MEADDEKMFLENIEEFVKDEGKIVTYKWLSVTLDIHVNTAKQLLYKYAMPNNTKKDDVHLTYLVSGTLLDGSGMKIQIVRDSDLIRAKSQYKLLTSEHIYSVQKASNLPDLNILYGVDNLKSEKAYEDRLGVIRCSRAIRRLENDVKLLRIKALSANTVASKPLANVKKGPAVPEKVKSEPVPSPVPTISSKNVESEPTKAAESKSTNGSNIASLFSAQSKASKNAPNKAGSAGTGTSNKPAAKKGQGGIAMFFTKQTEKQTTITMHKDEVKDSKATAKDDVKQQVAESSTRVDNAKSFSSKEKCTEVDVDQNHRKEKGNKTTDDIKEKKGTKSKNVDSDSEDIKDKKGKKNLKEDTNSKTSSSGSRKKRKSKENSQPAKKRKRIMVISDDSASSGEDIFGPDSDEEVRPPSPEIMPEAPPKSHSSDEDIVPLTPISEQIRNGKTRQRKLVNKTYADKDGFIMTKKEYVFESCSDDDTNDKQTTGTKEQLLPLTEIAKTTKPKPSVEMEEVEEDTVTEKPTKKSSKGEKQTRKKKASPPAGQKNKQATLMSFFNKK